MGFVAVDIDNVGDLLEGEERNGERENDVGGIEVEPHYCIEEVEILEVAQETKVDGDTGKKELFRFRAMEALTNKKVEEDRKDDENEVSRVPP